MTCENRADLGREGEEYARGYLQKKGYLILERNFTLHQVGEIDIIAEEDGTLVFVEVRTVEESILESPLESVTPRKQRCLKRTAEFYLAQKSYEERLCRFDVIALTSDGKGSFHLEHVCGAWE